MAWGKVTQFLRALSRVSRVAEVDPMWDLDVRDDGWEYAAMHYTPSSRVTPGNHP